MENENFKKKQEEFEDSLIETCVLGLVVAGYALVHWGKRKFKEWEEKRKEEEENEGKKHDSQD